VGRSGICVLAVLLIGFVSTNKNTHHTSRRTKDDTSHTSCRGCASTSIFEWVLLPSESLKKMMPAKLLASRHRDPNRLSSRPLVIIPPSDITFPPTNSDFCCTDGSPSLFLLKAHGGPTACISTLFNPMIHLWTSRGFGDYGSSAGNGRETRRTEIATSMGV
jgi:hypothetical protein